MSEAKKIIFTAERQAVLLALRSALFNQPQIAEILAERRRIHYDASIRKGFTAQEALVLCINPNFT